MKIFQVETDEHTRYVRELFWEHLEWNNSMLNREFDISYDVSAVLEQDMVELQKFAPPEGRLLLGQCETKIAGCACLRRIGENVGEIKRMYVRPEHRRKGIGRSLLETLIRESRQIGYSKIRLDSARFSKEAQALYRKVGFQIIEPYAETEIPKEYRSYWVFMEMVLR